jgi:hypothetical protein
LIFLLAIYWDIQEKGDYGNWPVYDLDAYHVHICIMYIILNL